MLVIRLRRIGKKNKPSYRVVAAEHTWAVGSKFSHDFGFYNPHTKEFKVDLDGIKKYLDNGAKPSNAIARLLKKDKFKHKQVVVIEKKKQPKKVVEEKPAKPAPVAEATEEAVATEETATEPATEASQEPTPEVEAVEEEKAETEPETTEPATETSA